MKEAFDLEKLNPGQTALLFFDFLNGHVKNKDGSMKERYVPVIANAQKLLAAARNAGMMVAYAYANHRADNATTFRPIRDTNNRLQPITQGDEYEYKPVVTGGTWETEVIDELKPNQEDYLIPKYRWSAFYQTYLDLALRTRGVDTIVLSGSSTDVGVASTAYAARDMDYHLVIVSDACTSPEADNHEQFMKRVFPRMSRVRTTEQVIGMLSPPGGKS
jgi:nicotinamidase-related amidase